MNRLRSYRLVLDRSIEVREPPPRAIRCPADTALLASELTKDELVEVFMVALLDSQHGVRPQGIITVTRGLCHTTLIHPREVFMAAVHFGARAVVCMHNHPSGSVEPSDDDTTATHQLVAAGELLDIPVLDHVIVNPDGAYFSFAEHQSLKPV